MRRYLVAAGLIAAGLLAHTHAFGADWAFTVDTPLSYSFADSSINKPASANSGTADFRNRTTTDVSGSKVMLIAPFHVGVGYEDYSANSHLDVSNCNGTGCTGTVNINIRMVDLMLDIPMRFLNLGLGYGTGTADVDFNFASHAPNPIHNIDASQVFIVLGIPFGDRFDLHLGYHRVTIAGKDLVGAGQSAPYDTLQASGDMLSAGLRLNF